MPPAKTIIAIAGNPNAGKTTVFNRYTGAHQHVGNYPGITVEKREGTAHLGDRAITLVDLPGTYSLTAYSLEEVVARRVLTEDRPGAVINVVNAAVLERNLYLTVQMMEMGIPVVLALNMMDEADRKGMVINIDTLEKLMGVKAVPAVARRGEGLEEALAAAVRLADTSRGHATPLVISYGPDIDEALVTMSPLVERASFLTDKYPARWVALKYLERDEEVIAQGNAASKEVSDALLAIADNVTAHTKKTLDTYPEAILADYRYGYIASILRQGVITSSDELTSRITWSDQIDTLLTHRIAGPLILVAVLYSMYFLVIEVGDYPLGWVEAAFEWLDGFFSDMMQDGLLKSMVTSGIIAGVGGVMGFVPLIMIMFLMISILEDSGYMARVAYMMDRIFRFFGLHGASIMPFIISGGIAGGCAVPGVMATRTLRSPKERLVTMLTAPFMACGAKLPVFLLFVGIFFESNQAAIMFLLSLAGWVAALLVSLLLRSTLIKGEGTPFVMELPPYRMPTLSGVLIHTWERTWQYIKKAGTIILAITIVIWASMTFPGLPESVTDEFDQRRERIEEELAAITTDDMISEMQDANADGDTASEMQAEAAEGEALTAETETDEAVIDEAVAERVEALEAELAAIDNEESALALRSSYAGRLGTALEVITEPAGFDWRTNIALVGGIAAKEVVVSTLGTAYSLGEIDEENESTLADRIKADPHWTAANAVALLLFTLLYSPCFVTLAVIRQESGKWRWLFFSLFFNLALAYGVAVGANQLILRIM